MGGHHEICKEQRELDSRDGRGWLTPLAVESKIWSGRTEIFAFTALTLQVLPPRLYQKQRRLRVAAFRNRSI